MQAFVSSGRIVDLAILVMVIEAIVLAAVNRRSGLGIGTVDVLATLLPGVCLLLALRAALTGQAWTVIALALTLSLVAHAFDLVRRWRSGAAVHSARSSAR